MDNKRRKQHKHWTMQKRSKHLALEAGMTGFLCTCNAREKECIRDAYRLLEFFSNDKEQGNGDEKKVDETEKQVEEADVNEKQEDEDEDISDALNKEIKELSDEAKKSPIQKTFQHIDTGVKNVVFIRTTLSDPLELATRIIQDLETTRKSRSRFLLRLIPVQTICRANMDDIKATASKLFEKYFAQEPKTFAIVFNRHCNNTIQRGDVIEDLAALIAEKNPGNKADLKNPEIAVVVEVMKGHCLLSIAPHYFKHKKYNLLEIGNAKETAKVPQEAESNTTKDGKIDEAGAEGEKKTPTESQGETFADENPSDS